MTNAQVALEAASRVYQATSGRNISHTSTPSTVITAAERFLNWLDDQDRQMQDDS